MSRLIVLFLTSVLFAIFFGTGLHCPSPPSFQANSKNNERPQSRRVKLSKNQEEKYRILEIVLADFIKTAPKESFHPGPSRKMLLNEKEVSGFVTRNPNIIVGDLRLVDAEVERLAKDEPMALVELSLTYHRNALKKLFGCEFYMAICPPKFDGINSVSIHYCLGPSAHIVSGDYTLRKKANRWRITGRDSHIAL
jgi:hypothetical protein